MIPVFDSNIIIDIGKGYAPALEELKRYAHVSISLISWMEVLVGARNAVEQNATTHFMRRFDVVNPDQDIGIIAADIRRTHRLRLPDAIIWATAQHRGTLLVTRNSKDFPPDHPGIRIPYTL